MYNVKGRVHQVRQPDTRRMRIGMKTQDDALNILLDQIGVLRMVVRMQKKRGRRGRIGLVPTPESRQVYVQHGIAVEHGEIRGEVR